ncbi:hypothetical protein AAFF_G00101710 [Aldrovandia affinis]|uniref:Uncharacterized protein n=1 Tax=Aldrovandia affinis TaxID=143900 RepID=A0AAD7RUP1_9TELE|nr:hypothetical protein AAFF_G00101710 [Aldrovandia affinis]
MFSSLHLSGLSCRFRVTCMEATSTKAPADAGGREGNELEHRPGHALLADSSLSGETLALPGWTQSRLPVPAPSAQGLCCDCCCWVRRPTSQDGSD